MRRVKNGRKWSSMRLCHAAHVQAAQFHFRPQILEVKHVRQDASDHHQPSHQDNLEPSTKECLRCSMTSKYSGNSIQYRCSHVGSQMCSHCHWQDEIQSPSKVFVQRFSHVVGTTVHRQSRSARKATDVPEIPPSSISKRKVPLRPSQARACSCINGRRASEGSCHPTN